MSDSDDFSDDFASDDSGSLDLEGASSSFSAFFFSFSFFLLLPSHRTSAFDKVWPSSSTVQDDISVLFIKIGCFLDDFRKR